MSKFVRCTLAMVTALLAQGSAHAEVNCEQFGAVPVLNSTYIVQNNFYNPGQGGTQCIDADLGTGAFTVTGNNWVPTNGAPGGYPSIFKGCHWGNCTQSSGLPLVLNAVTTAPTKWSVTPPGPGQWNISYDIWFAQTPTPPGQPDGTEIMIWINHSGSVTPAGQKTGNVNINGINWDVWTAPKGTAGFNDVWHIVSYVATSPRSDADFDLKPFFDDSKGRGLLSDSWFLIDVEAGFEAWQNGYGGRSNHFEVDFNKDTAAIDPKLWYNVVNVNSGSCVDDAEYGTKNGAKIQQWACNGTSAQDNQLWKFKPTGGGYYKVLVKQARKLGWQAANQGTGNGTPIQLWNYAGGDDQQWQAVSVGGGAFKFVGKGSGKCLDVPAASKEDGVQLQLYDCNGTAAQSFKLISR